MSAPLGRIEHEEQDASCSGSAQAGARMPPAIMGRHPHAGAGATSLPAAGIVFQCEILSCLEGGEFREMGFSLEGQVALVTGGGRGIGKEIARRYVEAGADVVIASRKMENLETTAKEFESLPGRVLPVACNIGKLDQVEAAVKATEDHFGAVDIMVNNGATNLEQGPSLNVTDRAVMKMVEINVLSAVRFLRLTVPKMIEKGGGSIINIASIAGLRPQREGLLYSFTKSGLIMMTRTWAHEWGKHGIRVNAIAPGLVRTDFSSFFWKNLDEDAQYPPGQPIQRLGETSDLGGIALYLASDESTWVTGQVMVIDGGATAR